MATIRKLERRDLERIGPQKDVKCTIVVGEINGERFVQLESYGSDDRKYIGKRSQNMRLTETAFDQLVEIGRKHFSEKN